MHVAGVGYLGLTLLVTWQALRAQPLLSPDVFTWAALWALVLGCALAATVVVWRARGALDEAPDEVAAGALVGLADAANDAAPAGAGLVTSGNHPYSSLEVPLRACGDEVDDVAVYDTRVKVGRDSVSVPSLAESNATSLDGLTSTFTLREGVRFHHGTLLAAASDRALMKRP